MLKLNELVYLFFPMLSSYVVSGFCKMGKDSGKLVKFRPPAFVFGIVWPILYVLLGISWVLAMRETSNQSTKFVLYTLVSLSLAAWIFVYSCKKLKKHASWVLVLCITLILACIAIVNDKSKLLLTPLFGWVLFAMLMNTTEVQAQA